MQAGFRLGSMTHGGDRGEFFGSIHEEIKWCHLYTDEWPCTLVRAVQWGGDCRSVSMADDGQIPPRHLTLLGSNLGRL